MKIWFYFCFIASFLIAGGISFCEQEHSDVEMRSKQGVVTKVDSIGSLLVIFDGSEQLRFTVDQGARIYRGTEDIMLDDLESNDTVTVEYYKSANGDLKVVSIIDNNVISDF
ncbi:MAG: hypothetical protein PHR73_05985 [Candidatus Omnitrophica bacterium]|nr:hypothetical protein [Candidatus Omnitrophota bacterium]